MKKETLLIVVVTLVAGFIIGLLFGQDDSGTKTSAPAGAPTGPMPTVNLQQKIGELMIKLVLVQPDYLGIAALVIAMTGFAIQVSRILVLSMETLFFKYILSHRFMVVAVQA